MLTKVGDAQTGRVGSAVPIAPAVVIVDENERGVPGVAVIFSVGTGGGVIQNANAVTDKTGTASAGSWTLGTLAGSQTLVATASGVPGSPATMTAMATAGPAVNLTKVAAEPACASVGATIDSIAVRATDEFGNPVPDETIAFTVTAGGGSLSPPTKRTLADGRAATRWTLGPTAGVQNGATAARANGSLPVTFSSLTAQAVASLRFSEAVLVVDSAESTTPSLTARDASGAPVCASNATLTSRNFTVASAAGTTVTGARSGQTFIVVTSAENNAIRDSALLVVAQAGKPAVTVSMPRFDLKSDTTFTVSLYVDSRSTSTGVGAGTLQITWSPDVLTYVGNQAGGASALVDVNTSATASGLLTIGMAAANGLIGSSEIRQLTFTAAAAGKSGHLSVTVVEMSAAVTFANLTTQTVGGSYPLRIR